MTPHEFIEKFREAFGEAAPLPIALWYSDTAVNAESRVPRCMIGAIRKVCDGTPPPDPHRPPLTLRVVSHTLPPKTPYPLTLRVIFRTSSPKNSSASSTLRVSSRAHPLIPLVPLPLCGSSPTLRVLKIVPSQVNRRSDTLKNSQNADLITIIIIVNSPILRIFRRLLLFSNE